MKGMAERAETLYFNHFGHAARAEVLALSGSGRRYFRLWGTDGRMVIATVGTDRAENEDFFVMQAALAADGIRVPDLYAISEDRMVYLQQDLGSVSLFDVLDSDDASVLVERTVRSLAHLQTGVRTTGTAALTRPPFDVRQMLWDLNYFKYCFLKPLDVPFDDNALEEDFEKMAERMSGCRRELWGFMYRDCQSRNVMIRDGEPYWIDFQGGRPGPMAYDVASLLWQARAGFDDKFRLRMIHAYADELSRLRPIGIDEVEEAVRSIVPLRVMQTLGAYGMRGLTQRKEHFVRSIPAALRSLESLRLNGVLDDYPEILNVTEFVWNFRERIHPF